MAISIVDEATPEETTNTTEGTAPAATSTPEPSRESVGHPAAPDTSEPSRGGGPFPALLAVLLIGAAGFGLFGLVQSQTVSSLNGEVSALRSEVSTLTATVAGLQTENDHYRSVLQSVGAATASLQTGLAELNQLVALPVPSGAAPAAAIESSPAGAGASEPTSGSASE
ncbi:MAG: hypothetical protein JRH16_11750 [Deltaproteobacteria bacterium]|nr:hypothetical protein [Deltaproteobacteria bacterium]MBW2362246.1 hypothetical protein [Deltaproteobacteria bacterium]